jgi:putative membrane protein
LIHVAAIPGGHGATAPLVVFTRNALISPLVHSSEVVSWKDQGVKVIIRILIVAVALWASTEFVAGITVNTSDTTKKILTLLAVALIFGLVNAVIKPIVKTIGCAFYILTLGLFALVVNALLLLLTSWIAEQLKLPFHVQGFVAAFWGAIIVGLISWVLTLILGDD